jgi:hypothetical protein
VVFLGIERPPFLKAMVPLGFITVLRVGRIMRTQIVTFVGSAHCRFRIPFRSVTGLVSTDTFLYISTYWLFYQAALKFRHVALWIVIWHKCFIQLCNWTRPNAGRPHAWWATEVEVAVAVRVPASTVIAIKYHLRRSYVTVNYIGKKITALARGCKRGEVFWG